MKWAIVLLVSLSLILASWPALGYNYVLYNSGDGTYAGTAIDTVNAKPNPNESRNPFRGVQSSRWCVLNV